MRDLPDLRTRRPRPASPHRSHSPQGLGRLLRRSQTAHNSRREQGDVCPHTTIYVSSYCAICVLIMLYMCPRTSICVLIMIMLYICVLIMLYMCPPYATLCVRVMLYHLMLYCVSANYHILARQVSVPPRISRLRTHAHTHTPLTKPPLPGDILARQVSVPPRKSRLRLLLPRHRGSDS